MQITMTLDSLTNARDLIADGAYKNLAEYKAQFKKSAVAYGVTVKKVTTDRDNDLIQGTLEYSDVGKLKEWILSDSPELSSGEVDELIQEAMTTQPPPRKGLLDRHAKSTIKDIVRGWTPQANVASIHLEVELPSLDDARGLALAMVDELVKCGVPVNKILATSKVCAPGCRSISYFFHRKSKAA